MSVINKMLKDLDNRQQPHNVKNISTLQQDSKGITSSKLPWLLVILLLVVGVGFYLYQSLSAKTIANSQPEHIAQTASTEEKIAPAVQEQKLKTNESIAVKADELPKVELQPEPLSVSQSESKLAATKVAETLPAQPQTETVKQHSQPVVKAPVEPKKKSVLEIKEVKLTPTELARKFAKQGRDAELSGDLESAREHYAKAIKLDASMHSIRSKLAALYYGERNNNAAVQLLNEGIQRYPQQTEFRLLLAKIQLKENQPQQALATLDLIADGDNLAPEKWIQQGTIAQQQKQYAQAVSAFKKLTVYEPSTARWWLGLGYNLDASGEYLPAAEAYHKALRLPSLSNASREYIVSRLAQITTNK